MEKKKNLFLESAEELKKVPVLTLCAMLVALSMVLKMVASIDVGQYVKIGFTSLPLIVGDILFGPVTGAILHGVQDIVGFLIRPTGAFFFGYTFNAMLAGVIYGALLYKKKVSFWRILLAKALVALFCNVCLNSLWMYVTTGKAVLASMPLRIIKNAAQTPVDAIIIFALFTALEKAGIRSWLSQLTGRKTANVQ